MKNVRLHMDEGIVLDISRLRGEMVPVKAGQAPVFDDPRPMCCACRRRR